MYVLFQSLMLLPSPRKRMPLHSRHAAMRLRPLSLRQSCRPLPLRSRSRRLLSLPLRRAHRLHVSALLPLQRHDAARTPAERLAVRRLQQLIGLFPTPTVLFVPSVFYAISLAGTCFSQKVAPRREYARFIIDNCASRC